MRDRFKVSWIHAVADPAEMVYLQSLRDWPHKKFVGATVRESPSPPEVERAVPVAALGR